MTTATPFAPWMIAAAQAGEALQQIPASLNLAASAVESGMPPFAHIPAGTNNGHGITDAHGAQAATHEDTSAGVDYGVVRGFKVFAKPEDSYAYYAWLLGHTAPYRDAVTAFLASPRAIPDVRQLALGIAQHYATDENKNGDYHKQLWKVMDTYNLYQYDALMSVPAPAPATQGTQPMATAAPATPAIVPASAPVVNAAANQTSLNIGDALEILVKAGAAILPTAIQAGESMLPPPLSTIIQIFGPSVFQGYITSAATQLEAAVAGKSISIPSTGNGVVDGLVGMVVGQLNANEFAWVSGFAGLESTVQGMVTGWLTTPHAAAVAPTLAAAASAPVAKAS